MCLNIFEGNIFTKSLQSSTITRDHKNKILHTYTVALFIFPSADQGHVVKLAENAGLSPYELPDKRSRVL